MKLMMCGADDANVALNRTGVKRRVDFDRCDEVSYLEREVLIKITLVTMCQVTHLLRGDPICQ